MKSILYLILENSPLTLKTLESIKKEGFNGTVIESSSLKHALKDEEFEGSFLNLHHLEHSLKDESTIILFIVDDAKKESLKNVIRDTTSSFTKIKGFLFTQSIDDFEGNIN